LYAEDMPPRLFGLIRIAAIAIFAFAACWLHAQARGKATPDTPLVIECLGKGTSPLSGPWQFHTGDDPAWANPAFDSSGWEQLTADQPWGKQGHARYTGYAWYRRAIVLTPAPGIPPQFSLLVPQIDDAYEIYWNGSLVGLNGRLQPRPVWNLSQPAQTFELSRQANPLQRGVLAIRVWKAPLLSDDSGEAGGFEATPSVGSPEAIATSKAALEFHWLRSRQLLLGENLLCALVGLLSFLLWLKAPARWLLFWMTGFALVPPVNLLLVDAHLGWSYPLAMGAAQPLTAVQDISLWFLLLWLLLLHENRAISRLTRILACICLVNTILDGVLVAISWNPQWIGFIRVADALSAILYSLL
jgi:hypothetical protein